jgi:hypothetical protein
MFLQLKSGIKKGDSSTVVAEQSKRNPRKTKAGEKGKKKVQSFLLLQVIPKIIFYRKKQKALHRLLRSADSLL